MDDSGDDWRDQSETQLCQLVFTRDFAQQPCPGESQEYRYLNVMT